MNLEETIKQYISRYIAQKIGEKFGVPPETSKSVIDQLITLFLGKVRENATSNPSMTEPLFEAVRDDHDGSIFGHVDEALSHSEDFKGKKILEHIFSGDESSMKEMLTEKMGAETENADKIFETIAPFVMGALGKEQHDKEMDMKAFEGLLN